MCGIVGLFLKDRTLEPRLGELLTDMLITMSDRGPDSAGIAIYGDDADARTKLTVQSPVPESDFADMDKAVGEAIDGAVSMRIKDTACPATSHAASALMACPVATALATPEWPPSLR